MADALRDVPQGKSIGAALRLINKLVPPDAFTVAGHLLPAAARSRTSSLVERPQRRYASHWTLWAADYDLRPDNQQPVRRCRQTPPTWSRDWGSPAVLGRSMQRSSNGRTRCASGRSDRPAGEATHRSSRARGPPLRAVRTRSGLICQSRRRRWLQPSALANLARLELQAGDHAIAAARLQKVMNDTRDVEATRFRRFLNRTHDERLNQAQTNERRRLLRDTLWYQAAYNLASRS